MVKAGFLFQAQDANGFEDAQRAQAVGIGGVFRLFKADGDMALGGEVVDFVGLNLLNDADEAGAIGQVAMMEEEAYAFVVTILVEMIDAVCVEETRATLYAVDDVAFIEQKFRKIGTVLTGNTGDEGDFGLTGH